MLAMMAIIAAGVSAFAAGCSAVDTSGCDYLCGAIGLPAKMSEIDGDCVCGENPAPVYGDRRRKEHH